MHSISSVYCLFLECHWSHLRACDCEDALNTHLDVVSLSQYLGLIGKPLEERITMHGKLTFNCVVESGSFEYCTLKYNTEQPF